MNRLKQLAIRISYYPTLWYNRLMCALGLWRRWDRVDSSILLGSVPSRPDVAKLKSLGISVLVNMCEEFAGHQSMMAEHGIVQLHLPTRDYDCPSEADLLRGAAFMSEQINAGRQIYVHCKAGRGRSAALVLCFLILSRRISSLQADDIIRKVRPHINRNLTQHPQVQAIERMVRDDSLPSM